MEDGPEDAVYATSKSGWMETEQFFHWFQDVFVKNSRPKLEGPIVLYLDGHLSHISIEVIDLAISNDIHLICLPPHTSNVLQPLDVIVIHQIHIIFYYSFDEKILK